MLTRNASDLIAPGVVVLLSAESARRLLWD